jgi:hypothetical protein
VTDSLDVAVNQQGLHTLEVDDRFEADGSFVVKLINHGEATHVHLHLGDDLSEVARLEASNHYVESGRSRRVRVRALEPDEWPADTVRGKLKVVVAHGNTRRFVDVVFDRTTDDDHVEIDPELAASGSSGSSSGSGSGSRSTAGAGTSALRLIPVAALGLVAVLLATGALVGTEVDLALGGFAVVAAALCAVSAYLL